MTTLLMEHSCTFIYIGLQLILLSRRYITIAYTKKKNHLPKLKLL